MYFIHSLYSNANIAVKARSCAHEWLADKAKLVKKQNKKKLKAKQTEINAEKGQTFIQVFLPHNTYFDKQTDGQAE